jgi:hypothetical protein
MNCWCAWTVPPGAPAIALAGSPPSNATAIATPGSTPIDLMRPEYWAHVAEKMKVWDKIEIRANDGACLADGYRLDVNVLPPAPSAAATARERSAQRP